ncbi:Metallo-dependent phosphatase [Ceratobasidium sp. AG-I]|nr:Metallo-dependent phosphatase [Ceratobasidium sp. AG-I]
MSSLSILHFNDAYQMLKQTFKDEGGNSLTMDVTNFAKHLEKLREDASKDDKPDPLLLFSGDLFSPSVESMLTDGKNMVEILDALAPDACLIGNHEFDYGAKTCYELITLSKSKWIISNVIDTKTNRVPEGLEEYVIIERGGVKIGVIGVIESEWIKTVIGWPESFKHVDMKEKCKELSQRLRSSEDGGPGCDIVIALSHSRLHNDIKLAHDLLAYPATPEREKAMADSHGIDAIFGGHDHDYYIGKGAVMNDNTAVQSGIWPGYDLKDTEKDEGLLIVKSGCDFRDLSEVVLVLEDTPVDSVRRKVIRSLKVIRHSIHEDLGSSSSMQTIVDHLSKEHFESLNKPICRIETQLNVQEAVVRKQESAVGNWIADILFHAYDDTHIIKEYGGSPDGVIITGGTIRGNRLMEPGLLTRKDIIGFLPFATSIVVLEVDGDTIHQALESAFRGVPSAEGCFPVVSGFRVEWNSSKPVGSRVEKVWVGNATDKQPVERSSEKKYYVVTNSYLASGGDGFGAFKGKHNHFPDGIFMYKALYGHLLFEQLKMTTAHLIEELKYIERSETSRDRLLVAQKKLDASPEKWEEVLQEWKAVQDDDASLIEPESNDGVPVLVVPEIDGRLKDVSLDLNAD